MGVGWGVGGEGNTGTQMCGGFQGGGGVSLCACVCCQPPFPYNHTTVHTWSLYEHTHFIIHPFHTPLSLMNIPLYTHTSVCPVFISHNI